MTRALFLGTPESAVPALLEVAGAVSLELVITQPDRPQGRSRRPVPSPVKIEADRLGIPVAQPATRSELEEIVASGGPWDIGVVVAYGRILPRSVFDAPVHGMLNIHFSLLPRWRGAAPVSRAIMAGDDLTGVTIMVIDEGLDTGPILTAQAVDIAHGEDAGALTTRLAVTGAKLLGTSMRGYLQGDIVPVPQSDEGATYAEKLTKSDRPLDLTATSRQMVNQTRALAPRPGATLMLDGQQFRILEAVEVDADVERGEWREVEGWPVIGSSDGGVRLVRVQPPGKPVRHGDEWLRGVRTRTGEVGHPNTIEP